MNWREIGGGDGDEEGKEEKRRKREEEGIGTRRHAPNSPLLHRLHFPAAAAAPSAAGTSIPSPPAQNPTRPIRSGSELLAPPGGVPSGERRRRRAGEIGSAGARAGVALGDGRFIGCSFTPPAAA